MFLSNKNLWRLSDFTRQKCPASQIFLVCSEVPFPQISVPHDLTHLESYLIVPFNSHQEDKYSFLIKSMPASAIHLPGCPAPIVVFQHNLSLSSLCLHQHLSHALWSLQGATIWCLLTGDSKPWETIQQKSLGRCDLHFFLLFGW